MGVFSKLKGIFYDEVVVDDDEEEVELNKVNKVIKKEPIKEVVEEKPKIEEINYKTIEVDKEEEPVINKPETTFSERDLFRSERTFNFVDFDDMEDEKEKEVEIPRRNVLSSNNRNTKVESPTISDTPKVFKPTPVISPIWGVMNKDYKVDEIKDKEVSSENQLSSAITSYDTVRRKAYGTLEDELEDTLNSMNNITTDTINEEINKVDKDVDLLEQKTSKIEDLINKIEEETKDMDKTLSIGELEDRVELENFEDEEEKEEDKNDKTLTDATLEHDLFNLIDSMYDDKEE